MANGGGRGWFQRRKPRPDPAPSPEPEPTRIEAYEAQRGETRTTDFMPTAYTGSAAPRRDFDDLVAPARNGGDRAGAAASAEDDHRWAPPEGGLPNSTAAVSPSTTSTDPEGAQPAAPERVAPDRPRDAGVAEVNGRSSPVVAPEARSAARYDWDAATAAALTDDGAPSGPPGAESLPRSEPDRLLEEIIREIVGDATAETVSSLQPAPRSAPSTKAESPHERTPAQVAPADSPNAGSEPGSTPVEQRAPDHAETAASIPTPVSTAPVVDHARPAESSSSAPDQTDGEGGRTSAQVPEVEYPSQGAQLPAATPVAHQPAEAEAEAEPEATAGGRPADAPPQTFPSREDIATPMADVSRETRDADGGTPLADQIADETRRRIALDEAVLPLPPSTRVFTISNQKGGVGKTTSAVNLAAALARAGAHVLVIDLDPQGNASTALGVDHRSERQSVYEVLVSDLALSEVIQQSTEHERLDCVPATIHLAGAEIELVSLVAREQRLRRALDAHLATMERPYDYVFIDCPPSLGLLTINAFVAAREVLIPIQCEYYALEGLSQLLSNIELIEKHLNPELRLTTILLTMYDSRTNLAQQVAQEVRDHFPTQTLGTIIPRSVRVSEAPSYGQSVISYDFASSGSLSYREAAAEIARRGASETKETH